MSYANILIVGASGEGKSSSIENLDEKSTYLIDVERKGLPFRKKFPMLKEVETLVEFVTAVKEAKSKPEVKVIVVDSLSKLFENQLDFCRTSKKGFEIYSAYNQSVRMALNMMRSPDKFFVGIMLPEILHVATVDGSQFNTKRAAVAGKEWEGKVEKEFTIVLHTNVKRDVATKRMQYQFITNNDGYSEAKSPRGMFDPDKEFMIPNDLKFVMDKASKYYTQTV